MLYPVLTGLSALQYHRTPPVVRELAGPFPDITTPRGKRALKPGLTLLGAIEPPIHLMVTSRVERCRATWVKTHLCTQELPFGSVLETEHDVSVTSPAATLLSLATTLSTPQLALIMYEFCGTFTVFCPPSEIRAHLQDLIDRDALPVAEGWEPALTADRTLNDLWRRKPLVDIDELARFAAPLSGVRGIKRLRQAMGMVFGVAASPFEAQAALLLGCPRRLGGEGLTPFELNQRIVLTGDARRIADQAVCYGDLVFPSIDGSPGTILECQGNAYHEHAQQAASDDNRRLALQTMGHTVVPLRYEQIVNPMRFAAVVDYLTRLVGLPNYPKSTALQRKAADLHRDVFVDWWSIGTRRSYEVWAS